MSRRAERDEERSARSDGPYLAPQAEDRLPPYSIEAEQGVLGCCLADPKEALGLAMERFGAVEVFFDVRHQTLFGTLAEMVNAGKPVDPIVLQQTLRDRNQLEALGGMSYIAGLMNATPAGAAAEFYIGMVLEKYRLRRMIEVCQGAVLRCFDEQDGDIGVLVNGIESAVLAAGESGATRGIKSNKDVAERTVTLVEGCFHRGKGIIDGVATGFSYLDKMLGGLHNGEYGVIAARPSTGKSALMMGIVKHVARVQKRKVGVFSVEMADTALFLRLWCDVAGVNMQQVRTGFMSSRDMDRLGAALPGLGKLGIFWDDTPSLDVQTFRARARRMKREGCELIVVDYVQLMTNPDLEGRDRHLEVASISRGIKAATKELNVPIVALAQLNRESERNHNRKPQLSDLRESGQIEQDADWVGLLYKPKMKRGRDEEGEFDEDGNEVGATVVPVNLLVAKQRNGPTGDVEFWFNKEFMRFEDRFAGTGSRDGEAKGRETVTEITNFKSQIPDSQAAMPTNEELGLAD